MFKLILIYGENGCGKTNILEAISLLSQGKGLRKASIENFLIQEETFNEQNKVWGINVDFVGPNGKFNIGTGLNKTSSKIELLGIDDSVFTNPVIVLPLPLNYGASIVDGPVVFVDSSIYGPFVDIILNTYGYSASLISGFAAHTSDTISIRSEIETEFTVDAYGSMKLPMGIYDCLRLKIKRNST